jgi:hypothetical protein
VWSIAYPAISGMRLGGEREREPKVGSNNRTSCAVRESVVRGSQQENERTAVKDNSGTWEAERTTKET